MADWRYCRYVAGIMEGLSADLCGKIQMHDELIQVDDYEIQLGDAVEMIRERVLGPSGSTVRLTFQRPEGKEKQYHQPSGDGVVRASHDVYTIALLRGPRSKHTIPNPEIHQQMQKISPSKITRSAPLHAALTHPTNAEPEKTTPSDVIKELELADVIKELELELLASTNAMHDLKSVHETLKETMHHLLREIGTLVPQLPVPTNTEDAVTFIRQAR